jgi:hypothetical protein
MQSKRGKFWSRAVAFYILLEIVHIGLSLWLADNAKE